MFLLAVFYGCTRKEQHGQNTKTAEDSLSIYLSLANDVNMPLTFKQKYNQRAFKIVINQENDSLSKANLFKIANRYYNMNDWPAYFSTSKLILEKSEETKDSINIARALTYLGDYYSVQLISDSAFVFYFKSEKIYSRINDPYNLAKTFLNKANLQYNESDLFGSEMSVFKALQIIKGNDSASDLLYESYNLLGVLYNERDEYDKALEFHGKALKCLENKAIPVPSEFQSKATSLNNIGYVYLGMKKFDEAKKYFEEGLKQENLKAEKPSLYAMLLDNLAYSKYKMGDFKGLPDQFFQALQVRDSLKLTSGIILNKIHLSEYYAFRKDTFKAVQYSKQALLLSRNHKRLTNTLEALKQIAAVEPENASIYSEEYIHINERLQKAERKMGEKFSRIEYETNEIKSENTSLALQIRNLVYVFGFFTLLGLFLYVYKTQQARNRELLFKQQQQIANEDIYNLMISQQNEIEAIRIKEKKKVAQELHDGVLGRMFGIRISLDSLDKIDETLAAPKRKKYLTELKNIEQDIREISHDLSKEKADLINNFVAILEKLMDDQVNTFSVKLISNIDPHIKWELVSNAVKINLYRIVQEALQNCNKYANANTVKVEFKSEINHLVLTIADDGIGFNTKTTKRGIGLQNIAYRTAECKGTFTLKSVKGEGTILTIKVPIDQKINLQNHDT
ncbi:tetratricopeptide repeat protein [Flavobacterium sp. GA093]|uniref:histidine kinase n=2 Tax=Flavobacterium hydrocarbonoxydans TaxID=2683249 RepID=A0A6I4NGB4_9FLAO|nr:tetratricopeptide repeat protein [Flavobacterium hydrocarbonoxydans]